jgi:hypothetical protein
VCLEESVAHCGSGTDEWWWSVWRSVCEMLGGMCPAERVWRAWRWNVSG